MRSLLHTVLLMAAMPVSLWADIYSPHYLSSLLAQIPRLDLASIPTPLTYLPTLSAQYQRSIYLKDDAQTGSLEDKLHPYGDNKIRKLSYLLADALERQAQEVITFGCIGSNHVAATATLCEQLGLRCHAYLLPQPPHQNVEQSFNYIRDHTTECYLFSTPQERSAAAQSHMKQPHVYTIPTGGSSAIGCLGFVDAACELYQQMQESHLSFDSIYLAGGSLGTAAGLWLGLCALGVNIRLKITYVNDKPITQAYEDLRKLAHETIELLKGYDPSFAPELDATMIELVEGYCGDEYGAITHAACAAVTQALEAESLALDFTYTGKCMAHLYDDCRADRIPKEATLLFWNTYYAR